MLNQAQKLLITLVLFCTIYGSESTPFRQCAADIPAPLHVQLGNCTRLPCEMRKLRDYPMSVQFVATKDLMYHLHAKVTLTTSSGMEIPYELSDEQRNVCTNLMYGAYCPLYATEDVTYELVMHLQDNTPEIRASIEVSVTDATDGEVISCFITEARFRRPKTQLRIGGASELAEVAI